MPNAIVIYQTRTGRTKRMAEKIADGISSENIQVSCREVSQVNPSELLNYNAIVMGSPTQYGSMGWETKKFLDETANLHYKLEGKVGGAFTSSCHAGGGNETTILDILHAFLIHGMVIQGEPMYDHYGATSIGEPSDDTMMKCFRYGQRIASLAKRV